MAHSVEEQRQADIVAQVRNLGYLLRWGETAQVSIALESGYEYIVEMTGTPTTYPPPPFPKKKET